MDALLGRLGGLSLDTVDVTLISHTHGRQRRAERDIARLELQAAVKYGRREPAHPGRDGSDRIRWTHKGVVYITDATGKHEARLVGSSVRLLHGMYGGTIFLSFYHLFAFNHSAASATMFASYTLQIHCTETAFLHSCFSHNHDLYNFFTNEVLMYNLININTILFVLILFAH